MYLRSQSTAMPPNMSHKNSHLLLKLSLIKDLIFIVTLIKRRCLDFRNLALLCKCEVHHKIHDLEATSFVLMSNHKEIRFSFLNAHGNRKTQIHLSAKLVEYN